MVSLAMFQLSSKLMKHLKAFSKIKWNSVQLYLKDEHSDSDLNDWFADYGCEASGSAFCLSQSSIFLFQNILGWKTAHLENDQIKLESWLVVTSKEMLAKTGSNKTTLNKIQLYPLLNLFGFFFLLCIGLKLRKSEQVTFIYIENMHSLKLHADRDDL